MITCKRFTLCVIVGMVLPMLSGAQDLSDQANSLHSVLNQLYDEMMPMCSKLIGVGQGIAGFAATWYIASRVWRTLPMRNRLISIPCSALSLSALRL